MAGDRRTFLGRLATGAAVAAGAVGLDAKQLAAETRIRPVSDKWDMSWVDRVNGKFRAVFDSPKIDDGGEIWRAATWRSQIIDVYGVKDADVNPVLVIRHAAIPLVMNDAFWARHKVGKKEARTRALSYMLPGVILQPSGFFGLLEAQRAGCQLFTAGG